MEFFGRLLDYAVQLWPFRVVEPWERGYYLVFSRPKRNLGPGIYPVVPYFTDVKALSIAESRVTSPLLSVKLQSGKLLAFSVSARVRVTDVKQAEINVQAYQETTAEEIAATMAEALAECSPDRLATVKKRRNWLAEVTHELNGRVREYGVEVLEIQFTNWIEDVRSYRLLQDSALSPPSLTW